MCKTKCAKYAPRTPTYKGEIREVPSKCHP